MGAEVAYGADTGRLRGVASGLSGLARQVADVEQAGSSQLGTLVESWVGDDMEVFAGDWREASPQLTAAADRLSAFAKLLVEQAEQQDGASGGSSGVGRRGGPGPAPATRDSAGDPMDRVKDVVSALTEGDGGTGLPDLSAAARPDLSKPYGGLNWLIDQGTDWANDVYTEHVRDNPFSVVPLVEKGLGESSDFLKDVSNKYREQAAPWDPRPIIVDVAADELDMYRKILHDPKGWWDNDASTLDKVGIGVSVVPVAGLIGKVAVRTTKEVLDLLKGVGKHADDVPRGKPDRPKAPSKEPDDSVDNPTATDGSPPRNADEGTSDGAKKSDDRTPEEVRERGGGARELADPPPNNFPSDAKVQKKYSAHADDFGVEGNYNKANGEKFRQAVDDHVSDPGTRHIDGYYRGKPAILDYNPETGLVTARQPNGDFISGWKAAPEQASNIQERGSLR